MNTNEYIKRAIKSTASIGGDAQAWVNYCANGSPKKIRYIANKEAFDQIKGFASQFLESPQVNPGYGDGGIRSETNYECVSFIQVGASRFEIFIVSYKAMWFWTNVAELAGVDYETVTS